MRSRSTRPLFSFSSPNSSSAAEANRSSVMPTQSSPDTKVDPRRYFESVGAQRSAHAVRRPVCVYLETTNRCNLLCTTCPRTYVELEPPADMSWEMFASIVDQIPDLERAVLHGVGEPMLVKSLPRMVRYLKERGTYVLFNTNGTVLFASPSTRPMRNPIEPFAARTISVASSGMCAPFAICRSAKARIDPGSRPGSPD